MSLKRPLLLPLVPLYWLGVRGKNALYDFDVLRVRRLGWPVISVGSLSAGGAGKTPVVLMLAELLARRGVAVDVLSRGYGRGAGTVEEVDANGDAGRFGDEPLEMARRGVGVFVGAERFDAGRMAEENATADPSAALRDDKQRLRDDKSKVHLLDDGFQHRRLGRDLDLVVLTLEDWRDCLLPAGNLRETLASLERADVVVVREDEAAELAGVIAARTMADTWVIRRELVLPVDRPRKLFAFCGIARPEGFVAMLPEGAGAKAFPDHHAYTAADFEGLVAAAKGAGADGFVTTAKDAVKISPAAMKRLEEVGPVVFAELRVSLVDEGAAWEGLESIVRR
jgi:tetraacyldisaccharide 4'-kinase